MTEKELELESKKLEKINVETAAANFRFTIMQRKAEISRLEAQIKIQTDKAADLQIKIDQLAKELAATPT